MGGAGLTVAGGLPAAGAGRSGSTAPALGTDSASTRGTTSPTVPLIGPAEAGGVGAVRSSGGAPLASWTWKTCWHPGLRQRMYLPTISGFRK